MKTKILNLLASLVVLFSGILTAQKTEISGVTIPKTYSFNNKNLVLNGSSIREKYFMDIYIGSLYLESKSNNAKEIVNSESDMGFRLKIVSSLITSSKMKDGIKESFGKVAKQYPVDPAVFNKFLNLFNEKINKGDEFFIAYNVTNGMMIYKNKALIGTIKNLPLKKALYSTWLNNAISKNFSSQVLNGN